MTWHRLTRTWEALAQQIERGEAPAGLSPAWRMLLMGDGAPTRHFQVVSGQDIQIDLIEMKPIGEAIEAFPPEMALIPSPRLRRQIWLRTASGERLAYATSWWPVQDVDRSLENPLLPIWTSLSTKHTEFYRDLQGLYQGTNAELIKAFDHPGPFWGRHYLMWRDGAPFTLIYEVFSPAVEKYLGPTLMPQEIKTLEAIST